MKHHNNYLLYFCNFSIINTNCRLESSGERNLPSRSIYSNNTKYNSLEKLTTTGKSPVVLVVTKYIKEV